MMHLTLCSATAEENDYEYLTDVNLTPSPLVFNQSDGRRNSHYETPPNELGS